jgi:hypothetical protein
VLRPALAAALAASLLAVPSALARVQNGAADVAATAAPQAVSVPAGRLVLARSDVPGIGQRPATPAAARRALAAALALRSLPGVRASRAQASRFARPQAELWSVAFVLASPAAARAAHSSLVRATKRAGRRASPAAVGSRGVVVAGTARRPSAVLWWRGAVLGAIVSVTALPPQTARRLELDYAQIADQRIARAVTQTAWDRILDRIGSRGQVSRQTALDLFALAYAPLPGTSRPAGPAGAVDPTFAGNVLLSYWPTLSAEQQAAVRRILGVGGDAARTVSARDGFRSPAGPGTYGDPGFTEDPVLQKLALGFAATYAKLMPNVTLAVPIVAGKTTTTPWAETVEEQAKGQADTYPIKDGDWFDGSLAKPQPGLVCRVRVLPPAQGLPPVLMKRLIAHEVFHCFQYAIASRLEIMAKAKSDPWLIEGTADWAALSAVKVPWSALAKYKYSEYFENCSRPLFERTYDAAGFFGHVQESIGAWSRMASAIGASKEAAFVAAGGTKAEFGDSWASAIALRGELGLAWYQQEPVKPPAGPICTFVANVWDSVELETDRYSTTPYKIYGPKSADRPLLHVQELSGRARLSDGAIDTTDLDDAWFCVGGSCKCPEGTEGFPPPAPQLAFPPANLALAGFAQKGRVRLSLVSLEQYCKQKQDPPTDPVVPPPPGGAPGGGGGASPDGGHQGCVGDGCGSSTGDPHISPYDGVWYDFQAAGEFVLTRSTTDDLEVQVRQQPYAGSRYVAVNTAVAARVAGDRVGIYLGSPLGVRVNGRPALLGSGTHRLPKGGSVRGVRGQVDVSWPDGTFLRAWASGSAGMTVFVNAAKERAGKLTGLLGNFDGNWRNDIVPRSGRALDWKAARGRDQRGYRLIYRAFGDSWRVTPRSALFDYAPGQSTRTFTNRSFPARIVSSGELSKALRAQAEQMCRRLGIRDRRMLEDCVLDVGVTGDARFAADAALVARTGKKLAKPRTKAPPPSGAAGRWTVLSRGSYSNPHLVQPSLAVDGNAVVAAYLTSDDAAEAATFTVGAKGLIGLRKNPVASIGTGLGDPILLPRHEGGLQALLSGIPQFGVSFAARDASGAFAAPAAATSNVRATSPVAAVLAPDGTPVWPATYGGGLWLWKGGNGVDLGNLGGAGLKYSPAVGRDGAGRYWLTWFQLGSRGAPSGLFVAQFDPNTLNPLGAPSLAPRSRRGLNHGFACAASCRLVYFRDPTDRLVSWWPATGAPAVVARTPTGDSLAGYPVAAYTKAGKLWVAWSSKEKKTVFATLGNAAGAGGTVRALGRPVSASRAPSHLAAATLGERLVLAANVPGPEAKQAAQAATVVAG